MGTSLPSIFWSNAVCMLSNWSSHSHTSWLRGVVPCAASSSEADLLHSHTGDQITPNSCPDQCGYAQGSLSRHQYSCTDFFCFISVVSYHQSPSSSRGREILFIFSGCCHVHLERHSISHETIMQTFNTGIYRTSNSFRSTSWTHQIYARRHEVHFNHQNKDNFSALNNSGVVEEW